MLEAPDYFETKKSYITIINLPFRRTLTPNMLSTVDLAVLVISTRLGEFESGFENGGITQEHIRLLKVAGIDKLVILVNKMDDHTVNWDQTRFDYIQNKLTLHFKSINFYQNTVFIPVSGLTGAFIRDKLEIPNEACWYSGPSFLEILDNCTMGRDQNGFIRAIISVEPFSSPETLVTGRIESGIITKNQYLILMPNNVEILEYNSIITSGFSCCLHILGTSHQVTVKRIVCSIEKETGEKNKTRFVRGKDICIMRLESQTPICDVFTIRDRLRHIRLTLEDRVIAIGKLLKVLE